MLQDEAFPLRWSEEPVVAERGRVPFHKAGWRFLFPSDSPAKWPRDTHDIAPGCLQRERREKR